MKSGRSVGLVGAIFRLEDIRALVRPTWISPTVSSSLIAQDGSTRIETETSPTAVLNEASVLSDVLPRLLLALDRLTGRPTTLVASAEVPSIRATVQTSLPSDIAIRATWSDPSAAMPGFLLVGAMVCLLLMAILTGGRKRGDVSRLRRFMGRTGPSIWTTRAGSHPQMGSCPSLSAEVSASRLSMSWKEPQGKMTLPASVLHRP